jgi:hypothetical protein
MRIAFSMSLSMTLTSISFKYLAPFLPSDNIAMPGIPDGY